MTAKKKLTKEKKIKRALEIAEELKGLKLSMEQLKEVAGGVADYDGITGLTENKNSYTYKNPNTGITSTITKAQMANIEKSSTMAGASHEENMNS